MSNSNRTYIGTLKEFRKGRKIQDIANKVGLDHTTISKYLKGQRNIHVYQIKDQTNNEGYRYELVETKILGGK